MDQIATKISSDITARQKKLMFRLNQQSFNEQRVQGFQERGEVMMVLVAPVCVLWEFWCSCWCSETILFKNQWHHFITTKKDFFNWSIVHIQCCVNYCYTAKWFSYTYIYILFHYGLSQDIKYSFLCCTIGPCYLSILCIKAFIC